LLFDVTVVIGCCIWVGKVACSIPISLMIIFDQTNARKARKTLKLQTSKVLHQPNATTGGYRSKLNVIWRHIPVQYSWRENRNGNQVITKYGHNVLAKTFRRVVCSFIKFNVRALQFHYNLNARLKIIAMDGTANARHWYSKLKFLT
jgi:hypothetical protein